MVEGESEHWNTEKSKYRNSLMGVGSQERICGEKGSFQNLM